MGDAGASVSPHRGEAAPIGVPAAGPGRVLLLEEDPQLREQLLQRLREAGFLALGAGTLEEGIDLLRLAALDVKAGAWRVTLEGLYGDERTVFQVLVDAGGSGLQSDLVERLGFSKPKVTRILNRMEGQGLLERRREGLGNRVVLK